MAPERITGASDRGRPPRADPSHEAAPAGSGSGFSRTCRLSKKPAEVRMGSGKGTPELWVARVKPGRVIFEIDGVTVQTAKESPVARRRQTADQDAVRRAHCGNKDVIMAEMKTADIRQ